jgi:hypothetical protein
MYSIAQDMANLPPYRLKSRKPLWKEEFFVQLFSKSDYWKADWEDIDMFSYNITSGMIIIDDIMSEMSCFNFTNLISSIN